MSIIQGRFVEEFCFSTAFDPLPPARPSLLESVRVFAKQALSPVKALLRRGPPIISAPLPHIPRRRPTTTPAPHVYPPMPSGFTIPDATLDTTPCADTISSPTSPSFFVRFAARTSVRAGAAADQKRCAIEKLAGRQQLSASEYQKLEALKTEWVYEIHTREDEGFRPLAYYSQAGGAAGPTDSDNGQSLPDYQAGGAAGPTYGTNGVASTEDDDHDDDDDEAYYSQAGAVDGRTYSANGQSLPGDQAGGADGPTIGINGTESADTFLETTTTSDRSANRSSLLDDMRLAFERNRERPRRFYPRQGAAMRQEEVVLESVAELDEFEWPEDIF